ncbi:hypothetical protein Tco_0705147 [Tanacetum coccineum]|uniref:Uncharacterized protein n=1 Tax=Tanacetum coccineum TaxID=301880 RepID=A0ABQ4Y4M9_9ASTR
MAALESCPKHKMIAYLEKTEGNVEFHEVIDFLWRSYIYHARLTVSPVVSTTFVEQFWTSAKSKTINNVRHITAKVAGKSVSISEASIRSDLLFDDAARIDSLPNQAIFGAIQLMGPNTFSGKVTPLFDTMLVQPTQDEGASSERLSDEQPSPSPAPTSEVPNESLPDSSSAQPSEVPFEQQPDPSPRPSPRPSPTPSPTPIVPDSIQNYLVSDQAKEIKLLKAKITKLKKQAKPGVTKESYPKQGRKFAKGESSVQRDPLFDEMPEDKIDHMETKNAQSEGRSREMVDEDKEIDERRLSIEDVVSTDKEGVSTDFEKVSTDRPIVSTDGSKVSTDMQFEGTDEQVKGTEEHNEGTEELRESTEEKVESTDGKEKGTEDQTEEEIATQTSIQTPTSMIFRDDETIATLLLNMSQAKAVSKEKEKGLELKDVEETDRPRPTSTRSLLTLKPLPKINPKDKGKKKIEEEDESKIQEEWEAEEERNRIAEENAANEDLIKDFDDIKARIKADRLLAEKLQEQEREQFTIEERAKFLHDTIAAQRKFLAQQRLEAIRNKPPTKNQLRNQMMTYLKHVGNYKHAELKIKKFEEVQALYEKIKRSDKDFISIGSAEDERLIKKMNEKEVDLSKSEVIEEESKEEVQEEDKDEERTKKRKIGTRKKMKSRKRRYIQNTSEDDSVENDETESNGQKRHFSTLMAVFSIFDRRRSDACVSYLRYGKFPRELPVSHPYAGLEKKYSFEKGSTEAEDAEN